MSSSHTAADDGAIWRLAIEVASSEARVEALSSLIPGPVRARIPAPLPANLLAGAFVVSVGAAQLLSHTGVDVLNGCHDLDSLREKLAQSSNQLEALVALAPKCPVMIRPHQRKAVESIVPVPWEANSGSCPTIAPDTPHDFDAWATHLINMARTCSSHGIAVSIQTHSNQSCVVDVYNEQGITPLMLVSEKGLADAVELLLEAHADVNTQANRRRTPGDRPLLVSASQPPGDGWNALAHAAFAGRSFICQQLLRARADVRAVMQPRDQMVLDIAVEAGHSRVCTILLTSRADVMTSSRSPSAMHSKLREAVLEVLKLGLEHASENILALASVPDTTAESGADCLDDYSQVDGSLTWDIGNLPRWM